MDTVVIERRIYLRERMLDGLLHRALFVFVFVFPLFVMPGLYYYIPLAKASLLRIAAGIFLLAWAVHAFSTGRPRWKSYPLVLPLVLLILNGLLSSFLSPGPWSSLFSSSTSRFEELPTWLAYFVILLAALNYQGGPSRIIALLKSAMAGSVIVSLYGIVQSFGFDVRSLNWGYQMRSSATLGSPQLLGNYLSLMLPIGLILIFATKYIEEKVLWGSAVAFAATALLLTFSWPAWVGGITGLAFCLVLLWRKGVLTNYRRQVAAVVFVLLLVVSAALYLSKNFAVTSSALERIRRTQRQEESLSSTLSVWRSSIQMIRSRPLFGWGLDSFREFFGSYEEREHVRLSSGLPQAEEPQNRFLDVTLSLGVLGLFSYLWLLTAFALSALRMFREGVKSSTNVLLQSGLLALCLAYLVAGQFNPTSPAVSPIFWLAIGLTLSPGVSGRNVEREHRVWRREWLSLPVIFALVLACFVVLTTSLVVMADRYFYRGRVSAQLGNDIEAEEYYRKAISLNPFRTGYVLALARGHRRLASQTENGVWTKRAISYLSRGIKLSPQSSELYFDLAETYLADAELNGSSDFGPVRDAVKRGMFLRPYSSEGRVVLAQALLKEGKFDLAFSQLSEAIAFSPHNARALFFAGVALEASGDIYNAAVFYFRALEINPGYEDPRRALRRIEAAVRTEEVTRDGQ